MNTNLAIGVLLLLLVGAVSVSAEQAAGHASGLVAAFSFNEGSGTPRARRSAASVSEIPRSRGPRSPRQSI